MELVPDGTTPYIGHQLTRIGACSQPVSDDSHAFSSITQVFILPIIEFHGSLRGVTAVTMQVHRQFTIKDRQLWMLLIGQEVTV